MGRKAVRLWPLLVVLLTSGAPAAWATGDLSCAIDDANLAFSLFASTNRDHGTIVGVAEGSLTLKTAALAKLGREFKLERDHIIQQWFLNRELRLAVNVENEKGSLLLAITGQGNSTQQRYAGRYVLKLSTPDSAQTVNGRIKGCEAG